MPSLFISALHRTGVYRYLQAAWKRDVEERTDRSAQRSKTARAELRTSLKRALDTERAATAKFERRLSRDLRRLDAANAELTVELEQMKVALTELQHKVGVREHVEALDEVQTRWRARLPTLLTQEAVAGHVAAAVQTAPMDRDPYPHLVVERFLPAEFYTLLVESLPPPECFVGTDAAKLNLKPGRLEGCPRLTRRVWPFFGEVVTALVAAAANARFAADTERRFIGMFGDEVARQVATLPQVASAGRLMLRRPGYKLDPHLDPRRATLTVLLYLARPGDSEDYGTSLYAVDRPVAPTRSQTYYPEADGIKCTLRRKVPFRPNTALIFLNAGGAHAAEIPTDTPPSVLRYAYQFYVGPDVLPFAALLRTSPADAQRDWVKFLRDSPD